MKNNAFKVLGAEPTDDEDKLKELFEEKQLLLDDITEVQSSYGELINPRKRISHEIAYFSPQKVSNFNKMLKTKEQDLDMDFVATTLVDLGLWFQDDVNKLLDIINEKRLLSGFPTVKNAADFSREIEDFKTNCVSQAISFLDKKIEKKNLIKLFNNIVEIDGYECFFMDELIAQYELRIREDLEEKEKECRRLFEEVDKGFFAYKTSAIESYSLDSRVLSFCAALTEWDHYAQPLQVNMQKRGGQHDGSFKFIHDIRNRVVELSNQTQDKINNLFMQLGIYKSSSAYSFDDHIKFLSTRDKLRKQVNQGVVILTNVIKLTKKFYLVFQELDSVAEQLKSDEETLKGLKAGLERFQDIFKEVDKQEYNNNQRPRYSFSSGCYIATCVYGSYDCPEVWTLRRYRDKTLGKTWYGRLFIKIYYATSPTIVKWFGKTKWFKKIWKNVLDKKIKKLQDKGFENTPYKDIDWHKK